MNQNPPRRLPWPQAAACAAAVLSCNLPAATFEPGFSVSAERIQQEFSFETDDSEATIDTLTLAPGFSWGDWHVSASLPWQAIDGVYFFNNIYPNLAHTCSQINELTPLQKWVLVRNTALNQEALDYCEETGGIESETVEDKTTGWNDIEIFANYYIPPDFIPTHPNWLAGSVGIGFQFDNGDELAGLGNGAKQLFVETSWMAGNGLLSLSTTLGYYFVVDDNSAFGLQDHGYGSLDGRLALGQYFELGARYDYRQTDNDVFDDYAYLTYSLHFFAGQHWGGQAYLSDYDDDTGFPDEEYGLYLFYSL
ncbi:hypothetical protein [Ketobacter sp.]|uniref:hypothetical protein n=1 Tax=Ketobacter sp. TaxID=2083498 RepID=UPI000F2D9632|nr:hypothetical protein [Ketobacter sp.]RLU01884.1 MAG: hypothetical protein D9N14_00860 [Ketobacter sp.]